eukprot:GEMP01058687.1.p1 GENE.GEMP01058687.1~~GEMP01058687.1.p1  ORF type:complete len:234 (+),score=33.70 GEMP01058687.1:100-801(+)
MRDASNKYITKTTMWESIFGGSAEMSKRTQNSTVLSHSSRPAEWKSQRDMEFERDMKEHHEKTLRRSGNWFTSLFCFASENPNAEMKVEENIYVDFNKHRSNGFDDHASHDVDDTSKYDEQMEEEGFLSSLMNFGNASRPLADYKTSTEDDDITVTRRSNLTRSTTRASTVTGATRITPTRSMTGIPSLIAPDGELDAIEESRAQLDLFGHRPEQQGFRTSIITRAITMNIRA